MASITTKGQTLIPTVNKANNLAAAPTIATPIAPTTPSATVKPTASGVGAPNNTLSVTQGTTPQGGFVPMVNTPFTQSQNQALGMLENVPYNNPFLGWAGGLMQQMGNQGMGDYSKYVPMANREFDPSTMIDPYMNPYIQKVIDPALARIREEQAGNLNDIGSEASRVGAFGGAREGVERGISRGRYDQNTQETLGNLYYGGFRDAIGNALGQFNQERGRNLNTAQMGLGAAQTGAAGASSIGNQQIGNYRQAAQDMLSAGTVRQTQQQKDLDAVNNEIAKQQGFDMNRLQQLLGILGGLPNSNANSTTKPAPSWANVIGGTLAGNSDAIGNVVSQLFGMDGVKSSIANSIRNNPEIF